MKNVCIALRKSVTAAPLDGLNALLTEFSRGGYTAQEIRILSLSDVENVKSVLTAAKKEYENLFLAVDKQFLPLIKDYIPDSFLKSKFYAEYLGAGIYDDNGTSLFICSEDSGDTGIGYVKNVCIPFLQKKYGRRFEEAIIRTMGANATHVEELVHKANQDGKNHVTCHHVRVHGEDIIKIVYDNSAPKMVVDDLVRTFVEELNSCIYAMEDVSLAEQLISLLKVRGRRLSVAESFTGGGIARQLTSVSGASEVYFEGLNTYNEHSKIKRLGVSANTLDEKGAVSEQTAYEMALGLLNTGDCDVAISTTGLAGPKSDRSGLPVGLCYIAVGTKERIRVYQYRFDGTRNEITEKAIRYALYLAYKQLKDYTI